MHVVVCDTTFLNQIQRVIYRIIDLGLPGEHCFDETPPNGLALSRVALIGRERNQSDSVFQNGDDLRAAQRRRLQRLVRRQELFMAFQWPLTIAPIPI